MGLKDFVYRCPGCGRDEIDGVRNRLRCTGCGRTFEAVAGGASIRMRDGRGEGIELSALELARKLERIGELHPWGGNPGSDDRPKESRVTACYSIGEDPLRRGGEVIGFVDRRGPGRMGILRLTEEWIQLDEEEGGVREWPILDVRALQASSSSIQLSFPQNELLTVWFEQESSRRWEERIRSYIRRAWRAEGRGEIAEFQPRIRVGDSTGEPTAPAAFDADSLASAARNVGGREWGRARMGPVYRVLRSMAQVIIRSISNVRVEGLSNIPASGPCILLPNHQSVLDPLLVQGICPREVHTMTKSTQFTGPAFNRLLCAGLAYPVRRYRVDPQAVRVLLRRLDEGRVVCVYPEGERTWDGKLQPLRRGALRVILGAGVPVIPVGIEGTFDVWPRWASAPRWRRTVHLRFGRPLFFGEYRDRATRDAALPHVEDVLRRELLRLSGEEDANIAASGIEAGDVEAIDDNRSPSSTSTVSGRRPPDRRPRGRPLT